jgi:hypothetical protein
MPRPTCESQAPLKQCPVAGLVRACQLLGHAPTARAQPWTSATCTAPCAVSSQPLSSQQPSAPRHRLCSSTPLSSGYQPSSDVAWRSAAGCESHRLACALPRLAACRRFCSAVRPHRCSSPAWAPPSRQPPPAIIQRCLRVRDLCLGCTVLTDHSNPRICRSTVPSTASSSRRRAPLRAAAYGEILYFPAPKLSSPPRHLTLAPPPRQPHRWPALGSTAATAAPVGKSFPCFCHGLNPLVRPGRAPLWASPLQQCLLIFFLFTFNYSNSILIKVQTSKIIGNWMDLIKL